MTPTTNATGRRGRTQRPLREKGKRKKKFIPLSHGKREEKEKLSTPSSTKTNKHPGGRAGKGPSTSKKEKEKEEEGFPFRQLTEGGGGRRFQVRERRSSSKHNAEKKNKKKKGYPPSERGCQKDQKDAYSKASPRRREEKRVPCNREEGGLAGGNRETD